MPIFFLSGAMFPIDTAPKAIQIISKFNPLSYGVSGIRNSLLGVSQGNIWFNLIILFILAIVMLVIGSKLFSKMQV